MNKIRTAVCIFVLIITGSSCRNSIDKTTNNSTRYSEINFTLSLSSSVNSEFRHNLFELMVRKLQVRGEPMGLGPAQLGTVDYQVALIGSCNGAIDEITPIIAKAASGMKEKATLVSDYKDTARCVEKSAQK